MELPLVQILVVVAITQVRSLRTKEEKGFTRMANERELAGPKRLGKPLK